MSNRQRTNPYPGPKLCERCGAENSHENDDCRFDRDLDDLWPENTSRGKKWKAEKEWAPGKPIPRATFRGSADREASASALQSADAPMPQVHIELSLNQTQLHNPTRIATTGTSTQIPTPVSPTGSVRRFNVGTGSLALPLEPTPNPSVASARAPNRRVRAKAEPLVTVMAQNNQSIIPAFPNNGHNLVSQRPSQDQLDAIRHIKDKVIKGTEYEGSYHFIRPGFTNCASGQNVYTNHFVVKFNGIDKLYEYTVTGMNREQKVESEQQKKNKMTRGTKRMLMEALTGNSGILRTFGDHWATDYECTIISKKPLGDGPLVEGCIIDRLDVETPRRNVAQDPTVYTLEVKFNKEIDLQTFLDFTNSDPSLFSTGYGSANVIRAVNIPISSGLESAQGPMESIISGANKVFLKRSNTVLSKSNKTLCALRGYFTTLKPGMGEILLNVNTCMSAFYNTFLVSDFYNNYPNPDRRQKALIGLRVYITIERKNEKGALDEMLNLDHRRVKTIEE
ncbi:hypothetical protein M501DRAFT_1032321 [Patellaria atrata CBS 101060]|uniref:Argonaute linker 1 domain-containing protein n=1 Tax=Patellaria atrata CBS 101060 TaxID=1346257 RepID=A0A9P4S975_9PEZI|nr:hypothetical protein M501DRAFT_1032321 [Patellaria atrata CBS 101060]